MELWNLEISGKEKEHHKGKFSANFLKAELNLTASKNTVINYINASEILQYEKRLKVQALQEHHKIARVQCAKTMSSKEKVGPT